MSDPKEREGLSDMRIGAERYRFGIWKLIANVQNISNLIGREEYSFSRIVLSNSIFAT